MIRLRNIINFLKDNPKVSLKSSQMSNLLTKYKYNDWQNYESFDESHYKKNLVFRDNNFEMFIVCWNKKQGSLIHDHADNGCVLKILKGKLTEYRYTTDTLELKELSCLPKDTISYIDNELGYHKIMNDTKSETVSLHIYSPPKYEGNIYHIDK